MYTSVSQIHSDELVERASRFEPHVHLNRVCEQDIPFQQYYVHRNHIIVLELRILFRKFQFRRTLVFKQAQNQLTFYTSLMTIHTHNVNNIGIS